MLYHTFFYVTNGTNRGLDPPVCAYYVRLRYTGDLRVLPLHSAAVLVLKSIGSLAVITAPNESRRFFEFFRCSPVVAIMSMLFVSLVDGHNVIVANTIRVQVAQTLPRRVSDVVPRFLAE